MIQKYNDKYLLWKKTHGMLTYIRYNLDLILMVKAKNLLTYIYINVKYETLVHVKTIGDVITNIKLFWRLKLIEPFYVIQKN